METANQLWRFRTVSVVIVAVLGLQLFAVLARTAKGWPFIDYPMYATSLEEGDRVPVDSKLYAGFADGTEVALSPSELGLGDLWWMYHFWVVDPLKAGPRHSDAADSWRSTFIDTDKPPSWMIANRKSPEQALAFILRRYDQLHHKKIAKLRLEDSGVIVRRQGMERVPPQVVWTWSAEAAGGGDK
jgi:hypothetical protein